jgi:Outer membrane protein beta-barrel domain
MKTSLVVACLTVSTSAWAGGYVGAAIGTEPSVNDDFIQNTGQPSGRSLRVLGGWKFHPNLAVEGAINGFGVDTNHFGDHTAYQISAVLKGSLPLGNNFEAFGRAGLERTWLDQPPGDGFDLSGNGYVIAAGFEYRLDAVLRNASVFVDYSVHHVELESVRFPVTTTTGFWGLGVSIGF